MSIIDKCQFARKLHNVRTNKLSAMFAKCSVMLLRNYARLLSSESVFVGNDR